jgi:hypothetical protein
VFGCLLVLRSFSFFIVGVSEIGRFHMASAQLQDKISISLPYEELEVGNSELISNKGQLCRKHLILISFRLVPYQMFCDDSYKVDSVKYNSSMCSIV